MSSYRRKERNANFISTATQCRRGRGRRRKCHSSEEIRWPLLCVCECVYVCACISKDQYDWHFLFFLFLLCFPADWIIYVCVGVHLLEQMANSKETAFVLFWYLLLGCSLPSPSVFQINHLSHYFFIPLLTHFSTRSCQKCNHVRRPAWRKAGDQGSRGLWKERGEEEEKCICMCTQLPL